MPKFSVIVPVYKVEKYVSQCIESLLNQSFHDFEILVTDDCGGDNSMRIVEEFAKKDDRIKILRHDKNRGLAAARNTALDSAKGDYIVCLDSDDWMEENCLSIIYSEFQKRKTESIWFNAYSYYEDTHKRGEKPMYEQVDGFRTLTPHTIAAYADFTWIKAYTRKSILKYNLHWPEGLTFEDGEFYFKYFTYYPRTYVIDDCLINYRYREGSIVRDADSGKIKMNDIYTVVEHLKEFWSELGVYENYKVTLIKLIQNRIRMMRGLKHTLEEVERALKFLDKMKYPDAFEKLESKPVNPLVSIVIPVYNVEKYVEECILSVLNQTYKNMEIICVDDCGTDNSMQIVKKYAKKDKRIKIIKHKKNMGYCTAVESGINNAAGTYVFFVESDDFIEKDCIELGTKKLIESDLNFVLFKIDRLETDGKRYPYDNWAPFYGSLPEGLFEMTPDKMNCFPFFYWNKGYKREFIQGNIVKWQNGGIYEDQEFFFRVFTNSSVTYVIDKSLYVYRIHQSSLMGVSFGKLKNVEDLFLVLERIYNYLRTSRYFDAYKSAFMELVVNDLKWYRKQYYQNAGLREMTLNFFKKINFPADFKPETYLNPDIVQVEES